MTDNKIDLNAIPHPRDCHRVPVGATIPKWTPHWYVNDDGLWWRRHGLSFDVTVVSEDNGVLTVEPLPAPVPRLVPEESPIIASGAGFTDCPTFALDDGWWTMVSDSGTSFTVSTDQITSWSPAIVTKTGHGVMDDRDKRDRIEHDGDRWWWDSKREVWWCRDESRGSLAAIDRDFGPLRFADEVQS